MTCGEKLFLEQFQKKSLIAFQFLNFILQNWWFKMYLGNQNQRFRKLAVERRRKEGYWFSKYLATLHWSTTLNETIEINTSISLSVSFVIFRFYCHSLNKNNRKNRNLNGPLLDFQIWLVGSQFLFSYSHSSILVLPGLKSSNEFTNYFYCILYYFIKGSLKF